MKDKKIKTEQSNYSDSRDLNGWDGHSPKGQVAYNEIFERNQAQASKQDCLEGICSCCEGSMYYQM